MLLAWCKPQLKYQLRSYKTRPKNLHFEAKASKVTLPDGGFYLTKKSALSGGNASKGKLYYERTTTSLLSKQLNCSNVPKNATIIPKLDKGLHFSYQTSNTTAKKTRKNLQLLGPRFEKHDKQKPVLYLTYSVLVKLKW